MSGQSLYAYVWNNPTNLTDPSGFETTETPAQTKARVDAAFASGNFLFQDASGGLHDVTGEFNSSGNLSALNVAGISNGSANQTNSTMACYAPSQAAQAAGVTLAVGTIAAMQLAGADVTATSGVGVLPGGLTGGGLIGGGLTTGTIASAAGTAALLGTIASIKGSENEDTEKYIYVTYTRINPKTGEVYSGRTSGIGTPEELVLKRGAQQDHLNAEGFLPPVVDNWSKSKVPIRGREQQLIDYYGGARSVGGTTRNMINGVSDWNPLRPIYMSAAVSAFGELKDNSPPRPRLGP